MELLNLFIEMQLLHGQCGDVEIAETRQDRAGEVRQPVEEGAVQDDAGVQSGNMETADLRNDRERNVGDVRERR
jgi:hypothetical protein